MKIFFSALIVLFSQGLFSQTNIAFSHYSTSNGLSNNSVRVVFQDHHGFVWIGTDDGLNLYDGYRFTIFETSNDDNLSLSNNRISAIAEDREGNLWIGTYGGLNRYDRISGTFQRFLHDSLNDNCLLHNRISALLIDSDNNLWIGTYLGLQKYDISMEQFTDYSGTMTTEDGRKEKEISGLIDDENGNLWLGVIWGGLKKFNKKTGTFQDFYHDPSKPGLRNNNVLSLCKDNSGNLWIGNYAGGLSKLSLQTGKFVPLQNPENNITIWSICSDKAGNIWYTRTGLGIVDKKTEKFSLLDYSKNNPEGISSGYHYYTYCDNSGILWFGSSDGLSMYNKNNRKFIPYLTFVDPSRRYYITTFFKDPEQPFLWLGTFRNGIIRFNEITREYEQFFCGKGSDPLLPENYITCIFGDHKNRIWVGTDNGISVLNKKTGIVLKQLYRNSDNPNLNNGIRGNNNFMFLENDSIRIFDVIREQEYTFPATGPSSLPGRTIYSVMRENDSILWIATSEGVVRYFSEKKTLRSFNNQASSGRSLAGEIVLSVYKSSIGDIWAGTADGLFLYDRIHNCFVDSAQNFKNQSVYGISEDNHKNLWLLTERGISRFNPVTGNASNYDESDGIRTHNAFYASVAGMLYCNRVNEGYYVFHPDSIKDNMEKPRVFITRFLLFNKEVPVSSAKKETPLKSSAITAKEMVLKYNQTMISFEFTAINFTQPEKNTFAYMLEGFDQDWYYADAHYRIATYTNLNPGNYTFRVRAANSNGIWSENDASIKVRILPPPWKTWWAYMAYVLFGVMALLLFRHNLIQREKLKNKIRNEALEYERKLKMDEMKMHFFANISHEFRTPLTLILAPLNSILQKAFQHSDKQTIHHAGLIQRNANRLADLINQLLDVQKLEAKSLRPEICEGTISLFLENTFDKFNPLAIRNKIDYQITITPPEIIGWFDPDKTEKIVSNLLSNAFKFTRDKVEIVVDAGESNLNISVVDNGRGIPVESREKIFERFYHVDDSPEKVQEGTGLGLSLVKELVTLLNGSIEVESEEGQRTCFRVKLPLKKELFTDYSERNVPAISEAANNKVPLFEENTVPDYGNQLAKEPIILVVEDNDDLRNYLKVSLSEKYRLLDSANGKDGLELAREYIPDLIISDILMPEMDGVEMTGILKNDERTNHIPVILLTSLVSTDNKLKGFETGADDYITKPFNEEILLHRIANLIKQRKQLQLHYASKYGFTDKAIKPDKEIPESADEKFLQKMTSVVERHMENSDFTNEILAADLGLSVAVLYRKTNALMNCTPADFVRDLRIRRAIRLLNTGKMSVSEVGLRVGFNDPHYFGKWFKKNHGKAPSEIIPN